MNFIYSQLSIPTLSALIPQRKCNHHYGKWCRGDAKVHIPALIGVSNQCFLLYQACKNCLWICNESNFFPQKFNQGINVSMDIKEVTDFLNTKSRFFIIPFTSFAVVAVSCPPLHTHASLLHTPRHTHIHLSSPFVSCLSPSPKLLQWPLTLSRSAWLNLHTHPVESPFHFVFYPDCFVNVRHFLYICQRWSKGYIKS